MKHETKKPWIDPGYLKRTSDSGAAPSRAEAEPSESFVCANRRLSEARTPRVPSLESRVEEFAPAAKARGASAALAYISELLHVILHITR